MPYEQLKLPCQRDNTNCIYYAKEFNCSVRTCIARSFQHENAGKMGIQLSI